MVYKYILLTSTAIFESSYYFHDEPLNEIFSHDSVFQLKITYKG